MECHKGFERCPHERIRHKNDVKVKERETKSVVEIIREDES